MDFITTKKEENFIMLVLQGEDCTNQSAEHYVGLRGNRIVNLQDDFHTTLKIVGERNINGWGELLNGPAYEITGLNGGRASVPKREWDRIMAGKHSRE